MVYKCWKVDPDERPSFEALSSIFDEKMQAVAGYLELKMVFESQGAWEGILITYPLMSFITTGGDGYETMVTDMARQ